MWRLVMCQAASGPATQVSYCLFGHLPLTSTLPSKYPRYLHCTPCGKPMTALMCDNNGLQNCEILNCNWFSRNDLSYLTHELVELSTMALLALVFTLLDVVLLSVSQISFTALLEEEEEVDVSVEEVSPTSSVSEEVFSLLDELFPFCTIFIWLIEATEDLLLTLLSLLLLSVELLDTAENCNSGKKRADWTWANLNHLVHRRAKRRYQILRVQNAVVTRAPPLVL